MDEAPHVRLDQAMERRRVALRLSWRDVAREAGLSYEALRAVRRGDRSPSAITRARIEEALGWDSGSVDAILAGGNASITIPLGTAVEINRAQPLSKGRGPDEEWREQIIAEGIAEARKVLDGMNRDDAEALMDQMRTLVAGWRARRGERQDRRRDAG